MRNLNYHVSEDDLEELFAPFGTSYRLALIIGESLFHVGSLSEVHLIYDAQKKISKGFAYITFMFPADAVEAFRSLDKTKFKVSVLVCLYVVSFYHIFITFVYVIYIYIQVEIRFSIPTGTPV